MTKTEIAEKRKKIAAQREEVAGAVQANADAVQTAEDLNYEEFLLNLDEATKAKEDAKTYRESYEELMKKKTGKIAVKTQIYTENANSPAGFDTIELGYKELTHRDNANLKKAVAILVAHAERTANVAFNKLTAETGDNPNQAYLHRYKKEQADAQAKAIAEA